MIEWLDQVAQSFSIATLLLLLVVACFSAICFKLKRQGDETKHALNQLQNEFRAMNSGQLGMGREIRKVAEEVAHVELSQQQNQQNLDPNSNPRNFEQASILLARGATVEEVVEACDISPGEAELLAIMRHSAPSHAKRAKLSELL